MTDDKKVYIGDAVYANFDGFAIILTTEDGIRETNRIVIEPREWAKLRTYADELMAELKAFHESLKRSTEAATELGLAAVEALKEEEARAQTQTEPTCADLGCFES